MRKVTYFFSLLLCYFYYISDSYTFPLAIFFSMLAILLSLINTITLYKGRFSLSSAIILYTILTQFGLIIPYYFYGYSILSEYADWTLIFLSSNQLEKSIMLGSLAVLSFEYIRTTFNIKDVELENCYSSNNEEDSIIKYACNAILFLVLMYFLINVLIGRMPLFSTYEIFMSTQAVTNPLYSYILILFYVGTVFLVSSGNLKNNRIGCVLWILIVIIFALNGNKGEFMYALLASFGVYGIQGNKMSFKMILIGLFFVFILIPTITSLRSLGIAENLSEVQFNPFSGLIEMGMQIRTTVYTLEDLEVSRFSFLWGESYWRPIYNILTPFCQHSIATSNIRSAYEGYGYNQVVESYINFKSIGVLIYFGSISFLFMRMENAKMTPLRLAYFGSIASIFINVTRNYFAFVPGQLVLISLLCLLIKKMYK